MEEELTIQDFETYEILEEISRRDIDKLVEIRGLLGLKKWHDKDRIIEEIKNL